MRTSWLDRDGLMRARRRGLAVRCGGLEREKLGIAWDPVQTHVEGPACGVLVPDLAQLLDELDDLDFGGGNGNLLRPSGDRPTAFVGLDCSAQMLEAASGPRVLGDGR